MTSSELLIEAFDRIPAQVHDVVEGLTPAQLTFRLDSEANSIAWLVWHMSRIADDHLTGLAAVIEKRRGAIAGFVMPCQG